MFIFLFNSNAKQKDNSINFQDNSINFQLSFFYKKNHITNMINIIIPYNNI